MMSTTRDEVFAQVKSHLEKKNTDMAVVKNNGARYILRATCVLLVVGCFVQVYFSFLKWQTPFKVVTPFRASLRCFRTKDQHLLD